MPEMPIGHAVAAEIVEALAAGGEAGDVSRILADAGRWPIAGQRILGGVHQVEAEGLAPAMQPGIGLDAHQQRVHPAQVQVAADAALARAVGEAAAMQMGGDLGDS